MVENCDLLVLRNGIFPAISVNKGCHGHQQLQPSNLSPEETQEGKNTCHIAAFRLQPLPRASLEETQDVETQDADARELRCTSKA